MVVMEEKMRRNDKVNHPTHYNKHPSGVECIEVAEWWSFNLGSVLKYIWRWQDKGGIEDLEKALWYLNREIERAKKNGASMPRMQTEKGDR